MTVTTFTKSVSTAGRGPAFTFAASGDGLIVNAGVTLANPSLSVLAPAGLTDLFAIINGTLSWPSSISAFDATIDVTVGSTGRLDGFLTAGHDSTVANHGATRGVLIYDVGTAGVENWGTIDGGAWLKADYGGGIGTFANHGMVTGRGTGVGVGVEVADVTFSNDGTIQGRWTGVGIGNADPNGAATLENSGTIVGTRGRGLVASIAVELTNDGTIRGAKASLLASNGADAVTNNGHLDGRAELGGGDDVFHGENGHVTGAVWGQGGNDLLVGGAFADVLGGGAGNDTLTGGAGADTLSGSTGADRLSGGLGDDVFRFATPGDTAGDTAGDAIVASGGALAFGGVGTAGGDRIDVSAIDANESVDGIQHFVFGTSHAIGHLWAEDVGNVTHIRGNVAGGLAPEFDLAINDGAGVHASDYAGVDFIL